MDVLEETLQDIKKKIEFYEKQKLDFLRTQVHNIMEHLKTV